MAAHQHSLWLQSHRCTVGWPTGWWVAIDITPPPKQKKEERKGLLSVLLPVFTKLLELIICLAKINTFHSQAFTFAWAALWGGFCQAAVELAGRISNRQQTGFSQSSPSSSAVSVVAGAGGTHSLSLCTLLC